MHQRIHVCKNGHSRHPSSGRVIFFFATRAFSVPICRVVSGEGFQSASIDPEQSPVPSPITRPRVLHFCILESRSFQYCLIDFYHSGICIWPGNTRLRNDTQLRSRSAIEGPDDTSFYSV
ncbi:hypothetical protein VTL71DRAFT_565 [Oculimacula yallundae]|uniref:Uncharacterized protein n=1 Tax=Oculimacula yallundae TaxID=86028 RepID=A0ABR4D0E5_9HELO